MLHFQFWGSDVYYEHNNDMNNKLYNFRTMCRTMCWTLGMKFASYNMRIANQIMPLEYIHIDMYLVVNYCNACENNDVHGSHLILVSGRGRDQSSVKKYLRWSTKLFIFMFCLQMVYLIDSDYRIIYLSDIKYLNSVDMAIKIWEMTLMFLKTSKRWAISCADSFHRISYG